MSQARIPAPLLLLAAAGLLFFLLPLAGLVARAPWAQVGRELAAPETATALELSMFCSLTATLVALVLGIPLALVLSRTNGLLRSVLRALTTLRPAIFSGAVLCWARALGEFGATITFAGNLPGRTQTVPLAVYVALETRPDGAFVLSLILLAVSLVILISLRDRWLGWP